VRYFGPAYVGLGSKRESAIFGPMSAFTSCGQAVGSGGEQRSKNQGYEIGKSCLPQSEGGVRSQQGEGDHLVRPGAFSFYAVARKSRFAPQFPGPQTVNRSAEGPFSFCAVTHSQIRTMIDDLLSCVIVIFAHCQKPGYGFRRRKGRKTRPLSHICQKPGYGFRRCASPAVSFATPLEE
jgi:hypothetical protein